RPHPGRSLIVSYSWRYPAAYSWPRQRLASPFGSYQHSRMGLSDGSATLPPRTPSLLRCWEIPPVPSRRTLRSRNRTAASGRPLPPMPCLLSELSPANIYVNATGQLYGAYRRVVDVGEGTVACGDVERYRPAPPDAGAGDFRLPVLEALWDMHEDVVLLSG